MDRRLRRDREVAYAIAPIALSSPNALAKFTIRAVQRHRRCRRFFTVTFRETSISLSSVTRSFVHRVRCSFFGASSSTRVSFRRTPREGAHPSSTTLFEASRVSVISLTSVILAILAAALAAVNHRDISRTKRSRRVSVLG